MAILIFVFSLRYNGKTIDFEKYSPCHRITVAHFLNKGKWDNDTLENIVKTIVVHFIKQAKRSGKPIFCIVDDAISSKTKSSSQALHSIEDAYFHQSHLKGKQDYGHHAVSVMLSCNNIVLNYAIVMYSHGLVPNTINTFIISVLILTITNCNKQISLHHCIQIESLILHFPECSSYIMSWR